MPQVLPPIPRQRPEGDFSLGALEKQQRRRESKVAQTRAEAKKAEERRRMRELELEAQRQETEAEQREYERSPYGQAYETGKWAAPIAGGMYYGHHQAGKIEDRIQEMPKAARRSMGTLRRWAPYLAKSGTYFIPEGLGLRYVGSEMDEGLGKDIVQATGTGLLASGAVTTGEGLMRSLTSPDATGSPPARGASRQPAQAPPEPEQPRLSGTDLEQRFTRDQLREQARKAGLPTSGTKTQLAERLATHEGPVSGRSTRGALASRAGRALPPIAAGTLAYDATTSDAQAAQGGIEAGTGREEVGGDQNRLLRGGAAAGGAAAGTYGLQRGLERAGSALARYAPGLTRAAGGVLSGLGPGMAAADTNQFLAERMTESGGDPLQAAMSVPGAVAGHVSDTASQARGDFEDALQQFLTLMGEIKQGSADQVPRRPGPQL